MEFVILHKSLALQTLIGMEQIVIPLKLLVHLDFLGMEILVFLLELIFINVFRDGIGMDYLVFREDLLFLIAHLDTISMVLLVFTLLLKQ